jgi:hypothetical protein
MADERDEKVMADGREGMAPGGDGEGRVPEEDRERRALDDRERQAPEADRERQLFDLLTAEGSSLVPVYYRLFERRAPGSAVNHRIASSAWYQAPSFACFSFHKPISRCRRHDEP